MEKKKFGRIDSWGVVGVEKCQKCHVLFEWRLRREYYTTQNPILPFQRKKAYVFRCNNNTTTTTSTATTTARQKICLFYLTPCTVIANFCINLFLLKTKKTFSTNFS